MMNFGCYHDDDDDAMNLKGRCRKRILEMFHKVQTIDSSKKVLIMDEFTVKTVSNVLSTYQVLEQQVLDFRKLNQNREPMQSIGAIYFIQPTQDNVDRFLLDMVGRRRTAPPLYNKAFLFFTSVLSRELKARIKSHETLRGRLLTMCELNVEYLAIDSLGFVTNNALALNHFEDDHDEGGACLDEMASRIATVFVSMDEYPVVRYQAAKSVNSTTAETTFRDLVPTKLAAKVLDRLMKYKDTNQNFNPSTETCELLILDRSIDQISPVIHDWTYDAMCYDLLSLPPQTERFFPADDSLWLELRHSHIAHVYQKLHEKADKFKSTMLGQLASGSSSDIEISTAQLSRYVRELPRYTYQKQQLNCHVEIAVKLDESVKRLGLQELGQLEQDLVVGIAGIEDVINYLRSNEDNTSREHKLRLLMIVASIYPEVFFEGDSIYIGYNLIKMAGLQTSDMNAIYNLRFLGEFPNSPNKRFPSKLFSKRGIIHEKRSVRKKHAADEEKEETWKFSSFYPLIEEIIEKLCRGELSDDEYPYLNRWSALPSEVVSRRTRQPPTWAQSHRTNGDGNTRREAKGKSIFVFIAGGATRSELRVCHKLTKKMKRPIVLGSSSIDDPAAFISKMKLLAQHEDGNFS